MRYRTITKASDTGGLDRAAVRAAVVALRRRQWATPREGTGVLTARETPLRPYGLPAPGKAR